VANSRLYIRPLSDFGTTGIEKANLNNKSNIVVYPNPSTNKISIDLQSQNAVQNNIVSIYDIQGQAILQQTLKQEKTEINITGLAKGVYFLKVNNGRNTEVRKLLKE
jgi:hypothetical protein